MTQASCFVTGSNGNKIPLDFATTPSMEDFIIRQEQLAAAGDIDTRVEEIYQGRLLKNQKKKECKAKGACRARTLALQAKAARSVRSRPGQCECGYIRSPACPFNIHCDKGPLNGRIVITRTTAQIPCTTCC